jgi:hypothetical protein
MLKKQLLFKQSGKKVVKIFFLLILMAAAGISLINLGTAITRAEVAVPVANKVVLAPSVSPTVSTTTVAVATTSARLSLVEAAGQATGTAPVKLIKTSSTASAQKPVKKVSTVSVKSSTKSSASSATGKVTWAASAMKIMNRMASFDYSYTIRRATMNKIANYAKQHHIKVITAAVINSINE